MKKKAWIAAALALAVTGGAVGYSVTDASEGAKPPAPAGTMRRMYWKALGIKSGKLRISTVDATTQKPIPGAGCVIGETGDRVETAANGVAPTIDAPVFRNPRLEEMLAELHGALTIMCYKNGYRDAISMGVRTFEGVTTTPEIWMYPIGAGDRRIEPTLYHHPEQRVWLIELADKYRLRDQGQGPERPELTRPNAGVAPQSSEGAGVQTPPQAGPGATVTPTR